MTSEHAPQTMRALLYNQPNQTFTLCNTHPVPKPQPSNQEYLLKVHATALTKHELDWPFPQEVFKNYSPGVEMSGTVVTTPLTDPKFPLGSKVYMRTSYPRSGSAREFVIALESELALQPRNLTGEEAAVVPVSALTAWQALFVHAGFDSGLVGSPRDEVSERKEEGKGEVKGKGKKVLVIGASGSVGQWTTQLAHLAGFWVVGTASTRNVVFVRQLGADVVCDYTQNTSLRRWLEETDLLGGFDLVLDCVGGTGLGVEDSWFAARQDGGIVLSIVNPEGQPLKWVLDRPEGVDESVQGRFFIMEPDGEQLQRITDLLETGKVRPIVDSVFGLEDYKKALERVDSGKATGKVVVRV